jgi:hypothetical protein
MQALQGDRAAERHTMPMPPRPTRWRTT